MKDPGYGMLLGYVAGTWVGVLLVPAFAPGGLGIAMVCSLISVGTSAWAFVRTRNRKWLWPFGLTFPIAAIFVAYVAWFLIAPASCYESMRRWLS